MMVADPDPGRDFRPKYCCSATPGWAGHLVFAGLLMREFEPRLFVELGTHLGNSYFSFCQSAKENVPGCRCFAIDSWRGDAQAGAYSDAVYEFVSSYNRARFSEFSTLLRGMFDDFTDRFEDGSIDLLHIDGFHSYDAVSHDFRRWISKVRPGGIVLFHDIAERQEGFGVWKFWEEIRKETDESFGFTHSSGLGVWRKPGGGALPSPFLRSLFACDPRVVRFISNTAWSPFENVPVRKTAPFEEPVEFFTADRPDDWKLVKTEMVLVDAPPVHPRLETSLSCGREKRLRIDIGRPGHLLEIEKLQVSSGSGEVCDLLRPEAFRGANLFFEFAGSGENLKLRITPYTGDPQLFFALPGEFAGKRCDLTLSFSHSAVGIEEIVAAKISELSAQKDELLIRCGALRDERTTLIGIRERLAGECAALRENQDAIAAERDALQANQAALAADRDEAWRQVAGLNGEKRELDRRCGELLAERTDLTNKTNELAGECAALKAERTDLTNKTNELAGECAALQAERTELAGMKDKLAGECADLRKSLEELAEDRAAVEKICHDALRGQIERNAEIEQDNAEQRRDLQLLRKLHQSLFQVVNRRDLTIREQSGRERRRRSVDGSVIRRLERTIGELEAREAVRRALDSALVRQQALTIGELEASRKRKRHALERLMARRASRFARFFPFGDRGLVLRSGLFDAEWYLEHNPDVAANGIDPLKHFLKCGYAEDRDPSELFSCAAYRAANPDLPADCNPLVHYLRHGAAEGRPLAPETEVDDRELVRLSGLFDAEWYLKRNPDVAASGIDPLSHFMASGHAEGRDPSELFGCAAYRAANPDLPADCNPLVHFLHCGAAEGRPLAPEAEVDDRELVRRSGLFDAKWYLERNPDVAASGIDPLSHFMASGHAEGRDPSELFGCAAYRAANPDLPADCNPLVHFLRCGAAEGRPLAPEAESRPAEEMLARQSGLFDDAWYLAHNQDLQGLDLDLAAHFMNSGWREGREPSGRFSVRDYCNFNPDIKAAGVPPLAHFIRDGVVEGRRWRPAIGDAEMCRAYRELGVVPELYDRDTSKPVAEFGKRTVAVHLHLYYTDMAEYFAGYLRRIPQKFDLFVSLPTDEDVDSWKAFFRREVPNAAAVEAVHTPNRGRDIAPLIVTFGRKLMKYDFVAHIHSKRSPHAADRLAGWLDYIMDRLLGSSEEIAYIFSLLAKNDRIVFPPAYSRLPYDESGWGLNGDLIRQCIRRYPALGLKSLPRYIEFSHGSMFWARGPAMRGFLDLPFTYEDFPPEPIATDATLAHVLERLLLLCTSNGEHRADMLFLKNDPEDRIRYAMMREKIAHFRMLFAAPEMFEKKLILVSHDSDRSGAPTLALNLARTLKKMGYALYIILLKRGEMFEAFEECGTVHSASLEELHKLKSTLPILRQTGFRNALLNTTLSGALAPAFREADIQVVTLVHEMDYSVANYHWEPFARQVIEGSGKVVMPSSVVARSWSDIGLTVPADKLVINPQGNYCRAENSGALDKKLCHDEICREFGFPEDCRIVVAASAFLEKRKGVAAFIDTAAILRENGKRKVFFVWIGADSLSMLKDKGIADKLAETDNCRFPGFKPDLSRYMAAADVFFLPSLADPFPTVALQAAAEGTPIVLCDGCTGTVDFCRDFPAGVVKTYSAEAFAEEIGKLLSDPKLHAEVSRRCLEFSGNFHSFRQYAIELVSCFPGGLKKVSCIVPNYQYEKYLPERLKSIIAQEYPIYDIVFLDDRSNDKSLEVAEKILAGQETDYVILANQTNSGCVFRQWFKGIDAAKGDFVWIAEADDACSPDFLSKTVPGFDDPQVCLSYAQSCLMDSDGKVFNENFKTHTDSISAVKWTRHYVSPMTFEINDGLAVKNTIPNASAVVIRKSAVDKIDRSRLFEFKVAGDWMFYLQLLKGGRIAFAPEVLNYYRRHNVSVVKRNPKRNYQENEMIHRYVLDNFQVGNSTVKAMEREFYRNYDGAKPDFKPTLDYGKYLKPKGKKAELVFITDDLWGSASFTREKLAAYAEKREVRIVYCGESTPRPDQLEKIPADVAFCRIQDFFGMKREENTRRIMVPELSPDTLEKELPRLKLCLTPRDKLLIRDGEARGARV